MGAVGTAALIWLGPWLLPLAWPAADAAQAPAETTPGSERPRRRDHGERVTDPPTLTPGDHTFGIGDRRKYLLHVPAGLDPARAAPLVIFLHGGGGHMEQAARAYGWREKSDREGFVVAFPNGTSRLPRQHLATWNAGACCGHARDTDADDVGFVRAVIADIARRVPVDAGRIFATGMSNGGMMAHRLACEMADALLAVAAVAGTDNTRECHPARTISVMHVHARDDTHVLFEGGAGRDAFRDAAAVTDFTSVAETIERWRQRDGATGSPRRILDTPGAVADVWPGRDGTEVELVVTTTGGHSWPGSRPVRGKRPSKAVVANDLIWEFFRRQKR